MRGARAGGDDRSVPSRPSRRAAGDAAYRATAADLQSVNAKHRAAAAARAGFADSAERPVGLQPGADFTGARAAAFRKSADRYAANGEAASAGKARRIAHARPPSRQGP